MVKDSIPYLLVDDEASLQDSLRHDIYNLHQTFLGDTIDISIDEPQSAYQASKEVISNPGHRGAALPFALEHTDGVFILILLCLLSFSHICHGGVSLLKENFKLVFSFEKSVKSYKQTTATEVWGTYFMVFQTVVLMSISLYDILMEYSPLEQSVQTPFITIISFVVLISVFIIIKMSLYRFMGYIFDAKSLMSVWIKVCLVAIGILGICYFIPTLLLVYWNDWHIIIVGFMLLLFVLIHLVLFYKLVIFFIAEKFNFLYLIAYLCTVEILPYIFLALGIVYLYRFDVFSLLWLLK